MKAYKSKIKLIFISTLLVVFTGCSQSAFKYFDKEEEFVHNAQYTKVLKIVENDIVKAMANITYLNGADSKTWDNGKQNFIIGIYIIDEDKKCCKLELTILKEKKIQLNKTEIEHEEIIISPLEEKDITKKDFIYKTIPFRNNWIEYKLVSYEDKYFKDINKLIFKFRENREQKYNEIAKGHNLTPLLFWKDRQIIESSVTFVKD